MRKAFIALLCACFCLLLSDLYAEMQVLSYNSGRTWEHRYAAVKSAYSLKVRYRRILAANNYSYGYNLPQDVDMALISLVRKEAKTLLRIAPGYEQIDVINKMLFPKEYK